MTIPSTRLTMSSMTPRPNPDGWKGGSEDFGFVRTFDGEVGMDAFATDGHEGVEDRSNERRGFAANDLGGSYDASKLD